MHIKYHSSPSHSVNSFLCHFFYMIKNHFREKIKKVYVIFSDKICFLYQANLCNITHKSIDNGKKGSH